MAHTSLNSDAFLYPYTKHARNIPENVPNSANFSADIIFPGLINSQVDLLNYSRPIAAWGGFGFDFLISHVRPSHLHSILFFKLHLVQRIVYRGGVKGHRGRFVVCSTFDYKTIWQSIDGIVLHLISALLHRHPYFAMHYFHS